MPIAAADFFVAAEAAPWDGPDTVLVENLDTARLAALVAGPDPAPTDVDVSLALMDLVRDDLHLSGTSGDQRSVRPIRDEIEQRVLNLLEELGGPCVGASVDTAPSFGLAR